MADRPWRLNRSYQVLPDLYGALGEPGGIGEALRLAMTASNGVYNLLLAAMMRTFGRSFALMDVFDVIWVATILIAAWAMARRLSGPPAALGAVALAGNAAGVVLMGRQGWIHVPELALITVALAALVGDPGLGRRRTVAVVALAGAGALTLRPSAVIWIGTLIPVLAWGYRDARSRRSRALRLGAIALWTVQRGILAVVVYAIAAVGGLALLLAVPWLLGIRLGRWPSAAAAALLACATLLAPLIDVIFVATMTVGGLPEGRGDRLTTLAASLGFAAVVVGLDLAGRVLAVPASDGDDDTMEVPDADPAR